MNFTVNISVFILAMLCMVANAHAESKILVIAKDIDGEASGKAYLKKEKVWIDAGIEKRRFEPFSHRVLSNGTTVFFVPPGKYKLIMYHNNRKNTPIA